MSDVTCPECGFVGGISEFQDEENYAPDLRDACECPDCGYAFEHDGD